MICSSFLVFLSSGVSTAFCSPSKLATVDLAQKKEKKKKKHKKELLPARNGERAHVDHVQDMKPRGIGRVDIKLEETWTCMHMYYNYVRFL